MREKEEIYIYGTGVFARKLYHLCEKIGLEKFKGFVVSNINDSVRELYGYQVHQYSDVTEDVAIILGLDKKNTKEVSLKIKSASSCLKLWDE